MISEVKKIEKIQKVLENSNLNLYNYSVIKITNAEPRRGSIQPQRGGSKEKII